MDIYLFRFNIDDINHTICESNNYLNKIDRYAVLFLETILIGIDSEIYCLQIMLMPKTLDTIDFKMLCDSLHYPLILTNINTNINTNIMEYNNDANLSVNTNRLLCLSHESIIFFKLVDNFGQKLPSREEFNKVFIIENSNKRQFSFIKNEVHNLNDIDICYDQYCKTWQLQNKILS